MESYTSNDKSRLVEATIKMLDKNLDSSVKAISFFLTRDRKNGVKKVPPIKLET